MGSVTLLAIAIVLSYVNIAVTTIRDCTAPKFSCQFNNPCDPSLCVPGQFTYPGKSHHVYVECVAGSCTEHRCRRRTVWSQEDEGCVSRGGLPYPCYLTAYDCDARNPCSPIMCRAPGVDLPGDGGRRYVTCEGGVCAEGICNRRWSFDDDVHHCVRRTK